MKYLSFDVSHTAAVIDLFIKVFSASEGETEGKVIGDFVSNLVASTDPHDLFGCIAVDEQEIVGSVFFSRFFVPSGQVAFILSPAAVLTDFQGKGIGNKLINYGIDHLKSKNVRLVFTYGDPSYYSRVGFQKISENLVQAPFPLSQPIGWQAQSLDGNPIQIMVGATQCVGALNDPSLW